ncbi:MAG: hypothetical protein ABJA78_02845 [Ferruginibacter sp.]
MTQFLSGLFFMTSSLTCVCQQHKLDSTINIDGAKKLLYAKDFNILGISSSGDSIQNLIFKSSQGYLDNFDKGIVNGLLYLSDLKPGNVTVSVFKKADTGLVLKNYKTYKVIVRPLTADEKKIAQLKIKPVLSIAGYPSGQIPFDIAKMATSVSLNKPYRLRKAQVYFGSIHTSDLIATSLRSGIFDDLFLQYWKHIGPGAIVIFDNIEITDPNANVYKLNSVNFVIVE